LQERGRTVAALEEKPELPADLVIYCQAYDRLRRTCAPGGRIQLSEMLAYCELFDVLDTEEFVDAVQLIEQTLLDLQERTSDRADRNTPGSS
jgi:hypothetical protein